MLASEASIFSDRNIIVASSYNNTAVALVGWRRIHSHKIYIKVAGGGVEGGNK